VASHKRILRAPSGKDVPPKIDAVIIRVAKEEGMDPDLIRAVVAVESGFDPHALSSSGAMGLMQLMPQTAAIYKVEDPWDPYENVRAGSRYLKHLLDRYNNDLRLTLAAYNSGPTTVKIYGGVPPYSSTKRYIAKVMNLYPPSETAKVETKPVLAKRERPVRRKILPDGSVLYTNLP
jgi:soluble lytic murein transglycosylase-like protein